MERGGGRRYKNGQVHMLYHECALARVSGLFAISFHRSLHVRPL